MKKLAIALGLATAFGISTSASAQDSVSFDVTASIPASCDLDLDTSGIAPFDFFYEGLILDFQDVARIGVRCNTGQGNAQVTYTDEDGFVGQTQANPSVIGYRGRLIWDDVPGGLIGEEFAPIAGGVTKSQTVGTYPTFAYNRLQYRVNPGERDTALADNYVSTMTVSVIP